MENKFDILNELRELSPTLAAINKVNVFTVPQGYFEYLSADILMGIETENGLSAKNIITQQVDVPTGYFDGLANSILAKIKAHDNEDALAETRALSPMLYSIQNENVFEAPQDYFDSLTEEVLDKVKPQPKVIKMQKRSNSFFKYAVAAVFTGVMALGVFNFTSTGTKDVELPNYVKAGLAQNSNNVNVDQELAKISSDDIAKYLEANGTDVKAALVANSVEENDLPSQDDYMIDDKALDTYLNSINLDDLKN